MLEKGLDVGGEAGPAACIAACNTCGPQRAAPPEEPSDGKATPTELPDDGQLAGLCEAWCLEEYEADDLCADPHEDCTGCC